MIRFELAMLLRQSLLKWLGVFLLLCIVFAIYNGKQRIENQMQTIVQVKEKETEFYSKNRNLLDSIEKGLTEPAGRWWKDPSNPVAMSAFSPAGVYLTLSPSPLAIISTGQSDIFPYYSQVNIRSTNASNDNTNLDNPYNVSIGNFDLAFVLVFIFPLFIIAFSYNLLSSEREQGTFRLLQSTPIKIEIWLLKKMLLRFVVLVFPVLIFVLIILLTVGVSFGSEMGSFILATMAYSLFWFGVAFGVNLLATSSAQNAIILISVWLLLVLLVPSLVGVVAGRLYPSPSRTEYITAKREFLNEFEKRKDDLLDDYYKNNPNLERKPKSEYIWKDYWIDNFAINEQRDRELGKIEESFNQKATDQRTFTEKFVWTSPAILYQTYLNKLAQTDTQTYLAFQKKLLSFQNEWTTYFKTKFMNGEAIKAKDFDDFPKP